MARSRDGIRYLARKREGTSNITVLEVIQSFHMVLIGVAIETEPTKTKIVIKTTEFNIETFGVQFKKDQRVYTSEQNVLFLSKMNKSLFNIVWLCRLF